MRVRVSLIDREGENDPVEVQFREKNNGVRDDKSGAKGAMGLIRDVLRVAHSPLGQTFGTTLQAYIALLNAAAQAQAQKEATNESDSRVNQPAD